MPLLPRMAWECFCFFSFFLFFQRPLPVSRGHFLSLLELLRSRVAPKAIFLLVCASPHWTLNSERCTELTKSSNLNCRFVGFFFVYWLKSLVSTLTSALLTYTHFSACFSFSFFVGLHLSLLDHLINLNGAAFVTSVSVEKRDGFVFCLRRKKMCRLDNLSWFTVCFALFFSSLQTTSAKLFFLTFTETMIHNFITSLVKGDLWSKKCYMPFQWGKKKNKILHLIIATLFRDISSISLSIFLSLTLCLLLLAPFFLLWLFQKQLFSLSLFFFKITSSEQHMYPLIMPNVFFI